MPYIPQAERDRAAIRPETPGELNYAITALCNDYFQGSGKGYTAIAEVVSALECAKLEFYRRVAVPYEERKIEQNGDVYG